MRRPQRSSVLLLWCALGLVVFSGCGTLNDAIKQKSPEELQNERIDNLSNALSRSQNRLEELDAKLSALTDKLENTKIILDNLTNNMVPKTEKVGSLKLAPETLASATKKEEETVSAEPLAEAVTEFKAALQFMKDQKFTEAAEAFHQITQSHSRSVIASSARFHAAEAYFGMGEFKLALAEYGKVLQLYPDSPHAASALVRTGQVQSKLGLVEESKRSFELAKTLFEGHPSLDWTEGSAP